MTNLDVWYAHADMDQLKAQFDAQMKARQRKMVDKGMAKARTRDSMQEVAKLTRLVDGRPRIIADPPLIVPVADLLPKKMDQETFASADPGPARQVPADAGNRPAVPARAVRVR